MSRVGSSRRSSILLLIDEEKDELVFSLVHGDEAELPEDTQLRKLFRLKLSKFREPDTQVEEERLAATVLATLVHLGDRDLGYKGYAKLSSIASATLHAEIQKRLGRGDPEAQFYVAWDYVKQSTDLNDPSKLDVAEEYFRKAAASGHPVAVDFLERGWPQIKEERLRAIEAKRNKNE